VAHLAREHCSAGVSGRAWAMWLTSRLLIGARALHRHDPVFIALQASSLTSTAVIVLLTHPYPGGLRRSRSFACRRPAASRAGPATETA
jgi:hypothetical protein